MDITGHTGYNAGNTPDSPSISGAFYMSGNLVTVTGSNYAKHKNVQFAASRNWTGKTSSNGSHSHTITSTTTTSTSITNNSSVSSIYGKTDTVRPAALGIRVKTRAK